VTTFLAEKELRGQKTACLRRAAVGANAGNFLTEAAPRWARARLELWTLKFAVFDAARSRSYAKLIFFGSIFFGLSQMF